MQNLFLLYQQLVIVLVARIRLNFGGLMHQSIETPAPRPPGHSGEFNIYPVLKDGLFPRARGQETC